MLRLWLERIGAWVCWDQSLCSGFSWRPQVCCLLVSFQLSKAIWSILSVIICLSKTLSPARFLNFFNFQNFAMSPGTFLKFLTFKANFSIAFDIFVRSSFNLLNHLQFKASQATASLKKCPPAVCGPCTSRPSRSGQSYR